MEVRRRREYGNTASSQQFSKKDMNRAFTDWKVWAFSVAQFGVDTMLYGIPPLTTTTTTPFSLPPTDQTRRHENISSKTNFHQQATQHSSPP
jgi:hypothetical protein